MDWKKPKSQSNDGEAKEYGESERWNPEGPDEILGVLKLKKSVKGPHGLSTLLKIETAQGKTWDVWCNRTSLKTLVEENDAELIVGRVVGIRTEGKVEIEGGKTFFPYEMGFGDESDVPAPEAKARPAPVDHDDEPF
jgi:hypothetical protein